MAEEHDKNAQEPQEPKGDPIRDSAAFKAVVNQLNQANAKLEEISRKAERERAEAESRKAAEAGDYQKAISELQRQAQAEIEAARAEAEQHKRVAVESRLMAEMAVMGVQDSPVVRAGIVSLYWGQAEPPDPAEFLKNLGDQLPKVGKQPIQAPPGSTPASRGGGSHEQLRADYSIGWIAAANDPALRQRRDKAVAEVKAYKNLHGKLPWE